MQKLGVNLALLISQVTERITLDLSVVLHLFFKITKVRTGLKYFLRSGFLTLTVAGNVLSSVDIWSIITARGGTTAQLSGNVARHRGNFNSR